MKKIFRFANKHFIFSLWASVVIIIFSSIFIEQGVYNYMSIGSNYIINTADRMTPIFIKGEYNNSTIKFIACFCERCRKGYNEAHEINDATNNREFGTYSEKYFDK